MAAGACLEDDVVEALLVELWCVAADCAHDRVEVEVARRDQLALELGPDRHRRRRRQKHVARLDRAVLLGVAALDEVVDDDAAVFVLLEGDAERLLEDHLVAVLRKLEQLRVRVAVLLRVLGSPRVEASVERVAKVHADRGGARCGYA